jgi:carbamoylphosphate synthase large subunit
VTQFGGQTPLRLARAIEEGGYRILGTPHEAIDLAEDRERFGLLADELGVRCPPWAIASDVPEALVAAEVIGYPLLVRPSYVLGGRAMRICYDAEQLEAAMAAVEGTVLLDRFVENAIELDVDALCDGSDVYIAAVMQHVEEAGVHSGDSACVLPAPSLTLAAALEVERVVKRLGPALGVVGILNVQLAIADSTVYVLEVNPRASRTVPFASKAIGRESRRRRLSALGGATLAELDLPVPRPSQVSVKAAVLPFARFPGADPVLGPEMRSTGEVMASAADLPTALAKAERAAGRPLPTSGTAFLSVRDEDKPQPCRSRRLSRDSASTSWPPRALRAPSVRLASRSRRSRRWRTPTTRRRRSSTSSGTAAATSSSTRLRERSARGRLPHPRGGARRTRPVRDDDLGRSRGRARDRERASRVGALAAGAHRDRGVNARREPLTVLGCDPVGAYALLRLERGGSSRRARAVLHARGAGTVLPRPMSLCQAAAGELAFLMEPIGPGTRALCALERGAEIHVFGPLGNGFDLTVERPLLVAGGIGIAPMPFVLDALAEPHRRSSGSGATVHAEAAMLVPGRRSSWSRDW